MLISLIVAVSKNGIIGRDGDLAWKISDDLKRFRTLTIGKPVIMGRKTFDSIGRPLPDRANIVISRSMSAVEGVIVARTIEDGLRKASDAAAKLGSNEIVVIGGAEIYAATLPLAGRIYLTEVDTAVDGDVRFPAFEPAEWTRHPDGAAEKSPRNEYGCKFFILDRN
jgi:dihydrofolate reductase